MMLINSSIGNLEVFESHNSEDGNCESDESNRMTDGLTFNDWDIRKLIMNQGKDDDEPLNLISQDVGEQLDQLDVDQNNELVLIQNLLDENERRKTDSELAMRKPPEIITHFSRDSLTGGSISSSFEIVSPAVTSTTTFTPITPTSFHEDIHYEHEENDLNKDKQIFTFSLSHENLPSDFMPTKSYTSFNATTQIQGQMADQFTSESLESLPQNKVSESMYDVTTFMSSLHQAYGYVFDKLCADQHQHHHQQVQQPDYDHHNPQQHQQKQQQQQEQQQQQPDDLSGLITDCFGDIFDTKKLHQSDKILEQLTQPSSSIESNVRSLKPQFNIPSSVQYAALQHDINDLRFLKEWEMLHQSQKSKRQSSQLRSTSLTLPSHTQSSPSLSPSSKRKLSLPSGSCFGFEPNLSLRASSTYIPSQTMRPYKRVKVQDEITGQDVRDDEFDRETRCQDEIKKLKAHYSHVVAMEQQNEAKRVKSKINDKVMEQVQSHLENDNKYLQTKIDNLTKLIQDLKSAFNQRIFQLKSINAIPFDYSVELNQSTSIGSLMLINQLIESIKPNQSAIPNPNDILNLNPCDILSPSEIINPSDIEVFATSTQTISEIHNFGDTQSPRDMTCDTQVCTTSTQTINETQLMFEHHHSSQSDDDEHQVILSDDDSTDLIDFDDIFRSEYH